VSKANKRERQRENRERAREERERMMRREKQWRTVRGMLFLLIPVAAVFLVIALTSGDDSAKSDTPKRSYSSAPKQTIDPAKTYTATITPSEGVITAALDAKNAPVATNNFVFLARHHFYDGLCIDRAARGYVIQGGSPKCDRQGGPGYTVKGEVPTDHYPVGSVAAAKGDGDAAGSFGSQFFIVTGDQGGALPNDYARFGSVDGGMEVAQKIDALAPTNGDGTPTKKVTIEKITIAER
jgi:cyclophilin family peptidyl-prolyl cis-trans isomerase